MTHASTWPQQEILDFLVIWGKEQVWFHLSSSHWNAKICKRLSDQKQEKEYSQETCQCHTKAKELQQNYKNTKDKIKIPVHMPIMKSWIRFLPQRPPQNPSIRWTVWPQSAVSPACLEKTPQEALNPQAGENSSGQPRFLQHPYS